MIHADTCAPWEAAAGWQGASRGAVPIAQRQVPMPEDAAAQEVGWRQADEGTPLSPARIRLLGRGEQEQAAALDFSVPLVKSK